MKNEIESACIKCENEINEYLSEFEVNYNRLQKHLHSYMLKEHKLANSIDYNTIFYLRKEVSNKMNCLRREIRKIIEENLN